MNHGVTINTNPIPFAAEKKPTVSTLKTGFTKGTSCHAGFRHADNVLPKSLGLSRRASAGRIGGGASAEFYGMLTHFELYWVLHRIAIQRCG